jgi:hypothetical protein
MRALLLLTMPLTLPLALTGCGNIGGGETVVTGDDNLILQDQAIDRIAAALASFETTPEVTDADIAAVYAEIHQNAMEGDLDAGLVLLRVATIQRMPVD